MDDGGQEDDDGDFDVEEGDDDFRQGFSLDLKLSQLKLDSFGPIRKRASVENPVIVKMIWNSMPKFFLILNKIRQCKKMSLQKV